jgi:hypothetical protein
MQDLKPHLLECDDVTSRMARVAGAISDLTKTNRCYLCSSCFAQHLRNNTCALLKCTKFIG